MRNHAIPRPLYDERLKKSLGTQNVKVLTGIRRCGKSTLLSMLVDRMREEGFPSENIFFRRFDQFGMPVNPDADWLLDDLTQAFKNSRHQFPFRVFLDEIQEVDNWEKVVRQLHTNKDIDVFITGSNAYILSSDLATLLAGRHERIEVYPLSFQEYCRFDQVLNDPAKSAKPANDANDLFRRFTTYGGMPGLFDLPTGDRESIRDELSTLFDAVILNDVARRASITDVDLLVKLIRYVYSTSGSLFSTKKISDALTSMGRKVKPETIDNYLLALTRAYALYECRQEGVSGKSILRPLRKFYPSDTGFRNLPNGFSGADIGFQLENIVFMELKRRGYEPFVGTLPKAEIDFVAKKGGERIYIQVAASLLDDSVYSRELSPLEAVGDNFPKLILTLDGWREGTTKSGVHIARLQDWLLEA
ncbi:AAA family ATPase [Eggerthellaceae bacterium zg-893]|nr:AAA family ATPase [Eggerthellaceae bacterium zg-893]